MCWESKKLKQLVSDGKVKVFKVCHIDDGYLCGFYYHGFKYELNTEYTARINMIDHSPFMYYGYEGFHSYSKDECHTKIYYQSEVDALQVVGVYNNDSTRVIDGYTGYYKNDFAIVEGYLPEGTIYYVNEFGEIISDKIVLTTIIEEII